MMEWINIMMDIAEPEIPLNWIKKKYTFAVTFKCKVKKGRTLAHIIVSPTLDRAIELECTVIDGTLNH